MNGPADAPRVPDLVSTIVPVHDRPEMLCRAVRSVIEQTYRPIEVLIVNDGSTDETGAVADSLASTHPEVRAFHTPNRGPGPARETGRRAARGEFIQYLDSDDSLLPDKFHLQVTALRDDPTSGIAYGYTRLVEDGKVVRDRPYKKTGHVIEHLFPTLLVERWWSTHTPLYRRSVCDAVGPWADMRMSEDWEYEARVGGLGVRLVHCKAYLCETRRHSEGHLSSAPMSPRKAQDLVRLLASLERGAQQTGVPPDSPEFRHFARWAFRVARQAGTVGCRTEAREALEIALRRGSFDPARLRIMKSYRVAADLIGWRMLGTVSAWRDRMFSSKRGRADNSR